MIALVQANPATPSMPPTPGALLLKRLTVLGGIALVFALVYLLRSVAVPLFLAFLLAYVLDPMVDRLERLRVPRPLGAIIVLLSIAGTFVLVCLYTFPILVEELKSAAEDFPEQLQKLQGRVEPWLFANFKVKLPHTMNELMRTLSDKVQNRIPDMATTAVMALFGTLTYVGVALSALIVPVFSLYLLIDFDRIVSRVKELIPRRWVKPASDIAGQIHRTLGGYVRGQLTANIVLGALYASGLRLVDIRLAVPIGVLTGMLAFVPYIGFGCGFTLALAMATLDWHGIGHVIGVAIAMGTVQLLDSMVITPRIVGRSVGLRPLEVLVTMMGAASLFGFLGVLLAVPLGAVIKILVVRATDAYLASDFYRRPV
jgi:predicted PurR-regulated permease PerM